MNRIQNAAVVVGLIVLAVLCGTCAHYFSGMVVTGS